MAEEREAGLLLYVDTDREGSPHNVLHSSSLYSLTSWEVLYVIQLWNLIGSAFDTPTQTAEVYKWA